MRHDVKGDLLESDCNVILHQVNCQGAMASGIAGAIREKYPQVYEDYMAAHERGELKLGNIIKSEIGELTIYSLCGQDTYGRTGKHTDEGALAFCLGSVLGELANEGKMETVKVGVPKYLGCGLGGGDWDTVSSILDRLSMSIDLWVYSLENN